MEALLVCNMSCPQLVGFQRMLIDLDSDLSPILTSDLHAASTPHYLRYAMAKVEHTLPDNVYQQYEGWKKITHAG